MGERLDRKDVKKARNFAADESEIEAWVDMGYTRERAIEILREMKETRERWKRERSQPISEKRRQWMQNIQERMQAEATAGLTK